MPHHVQRILFIRLSAIGDIVMASGLPSSIKASYSQIGVTTELTWLVEKPYTEIVKYNPDVDKVITWPKSEWQQLLKSKKYWPLFKAIIAFRKQLKAQKFDVAIEAQGLLKSAVFTFISGAPKRIGFKSKERSQKLLTHVVEKPKSNQICSEYRQLAKTIHAITTSSPNCTPPLYKMTIPVSQDVLPSPTEFSLNQPFIALAPFTTRPQKHWPEKHWLTLIKLLRQVTKMPIVVLGGTADVSYAEILTGNDDNITSMAGKISLVTSFKMVSLCSIFIGVDTGLTHAATTYFKPTVALFGSTRPYTYTDNPHTHVLYENFDCAPCKRKPSCEGRFDCMQALHPEKVLNQLRPYINRN